MKRIVAVSGLIAVATIVSVTPAFAVTDELQDTTKQVRIDAKKAVESTVNSTNDKLANTVESGESAAATLEDRKQLLEERKTALRERLEQKSDARKTKLEGRRLAQCQNRQDNINSLIDKGAENGRRHFANIGAFEDQILAFAEKKSVNGEAYATALADVEEKKGDAEIALSVMEGQTFDCATLDGAKPAESVKMIREAKQDALRAYRDSVIQLIQTIKAEFAATQTEPATTEEQ